MRRCCEHRGLVPGGMPNWATARVAPTLGEIIGAFKSKFVTDILSYIAANKLDMRGKIWQRNYYERIIRNAKELNAIRAYIRNNPQNWNKDRKSRGSPCGCPLMQRY